MERIDDLSVAKAMLGVAQRRQALIAAFAKDAMQPIPLERLLYEATLRIVESMGVEHAKVLQYSPPTADLLVVAGVGWSEGVIGHARLRIDIASPAGCAFQTGQPVLIDDLNNQADFRIDPLLVSHRINSLVNVPIYVDGEVWGVLEADSCLPRDFTSIDAGFLATFAGVLGAAIFRKGMEAKSEAAAAKIAALADQRQVLLRELQHRVKNNLQIILSLISRQQRKSANPDLAQNLAYIADRVSAVALAHDQLTVSDDFAAVKIGPYLRALCRHIDPGREEVAIVADAKDIELPIEQAVPIGLIVNEAITNALKHAFPGGRAGSVRITFNPEEGLRKGALQIVDDGAGLDPARCNGAGRSLIQNLALQLNGVAETEATPSGGTAVRVRFPLRLARTTPDSAPDEGFPPLGNPEELKAEGRGFDGMALSSQFVEGTRGHGAEGSPPDR